MLGPGCGLMNTTKGMLKTPGHASEAIEVPNSAMLPTLAWEERRLATFLKLQVPTDQGPTYVDALEGLSPRAYTRISYADLKFVPFSTNASMLPSPG